MAKLRDFDFIADLHLDSYARTKLRVILNSTVVGSDQVLVTPIGKAVKPEEILKEWKSIFLSNKGLLNSDLLKFESDSEKYFSPRSIQQPWGVRKESIDSSFLEMGSVLPEKLISEVKLNGSLRPVSFDKAKSLLKNNTSAGLATLRSKGQLKPVYTESMMYEELEKELLCVLFTRTQENDKTRDIWGYPMALVIFEMMYYSPLLDVQKKQIWRSALLGPDEVDKSISKLVISSFERNVPLLSIDFKKYDASLKPRIQVPSWNYVKSKFQPKYHDDISFIQKCFNSIGIVTPSGVKRGLHGVPSGSVFTNEIDSINQYVISRCTGSVFDEDMEIQGDDAVYSISEGNVDTFIKTFNKAGLNVHTDTDLLSYTKCEYLRKLYHIDYLSGDKVGGIYSTFRALGRIVYQERWTNFEDYSIIGKDYYAIRTLCILENCKHHPLFRELVEFIVKLDKYKLKFSQDGLTNYVRMVRESKGSEGLIQNTNSVIHF